jgi:glucokinase
VKTLIGLDVGGTLIKATALREDGSVLGQWKQPTEDRAVEGLPLFARAAVQMISDIGLKEAYVGVAAPGLASNNGRSIAFMPNKMHGIENLDWTDVLASPHSVPVMNDAHAALLGEVWCGAAVGCRDVVLLTLGTGVGGAILSDGRLLKGVMNRAGHLGHVCVGDTTIKSVVGMPGALECAIGNYTVAQRSGGRFQSTYDLVQAYQAGDADAGNIWLKSVDALARAIASFVNMLDPQVIIIGGGVSEAGPELFDPLKNFLNDYEWRPAGHQVRIVRAKLGEWSGTYGAAWKAINL